MTAGSANGSLIVVGAINVDLVVVSEHLPGPGETVVGSSLERHGGGKGANAAVAAARSGAAVYLVGAVGQDPMAQEALADLRAAGVELAGVAELGDEPTGAALIVVDARGENQIAVGGGANSALAADWVERHVTQALPEVGCVLVSTEIPGEAVSAAVRAASAAGVTCVLNSAPPISSVVELLDQAPVLTPNTRELTKLTEMLTGSDPAGDSGQAVDSGPAADPRQAAVALAERTGRPVVVTLGGDGALIATADGVSEQIRPPAVEVRDTTGAGDTFNGVLAARLAAGQTLTDAVRLAVVAAALSVSHSGARTGMPTRQEIDQALNRATGGGTERGRPARGRMSLYKNLEVEMRAGNLEITERAELVDRFSAAWGEKDIKTLMELMTDDCTFRASVGPEPGVTFVGREEVRRGFEQFLAGGNDDPAPQTETEAPLISRDFAVTRWTTRFRNSDLVVRACDILGFEGDRIKFKDTYRKVAGWPHGVPGGSEERGSSA
jgi:ribokinase